jgi:hypothetical protein
METQRGKSFKIRARVSVDNLDIFSYVNSKFVYVEKHIKTQLSRLYQDIMEQKCVLERQILQNALLLASIAPDKMASRIMKAPGYTAVTAGEVIHLIKCVPVNCKIRHTEHCHNELPIIYNNVSMFLLPRSRIITKTGTIRDCNELLPVMYKIHDIWFRIGTRSTETLPPPVIQPLTKPLWKYMIPTTLATSGIYTSEDLDRLRNHIMFPVEKPSTLNNLAKGTMGHAIPVGSLSTAGLLDEQALNKIAESTGKKLWKGFMNFGSASAGILEIILIIRIIKLFVDTIIHGYTLHTVYGWSIHLLGTIWLSITHLLLHLAKSPKKEEQKDVENNTPEVQRDPEPATETSQQLKENIANKDLSYQELRKYLQD